MQLTSKENLGTNVNEVSGGNVPSPTVQSLPYGNFEDLGGTNINEENTLLWTYLPFENVLCLAQKNIAFSPSFTHHLVFAPKSQEGRSTLEETISALTTIPNYPKFCLTFTFEELEEPI